MRSFLINGNGLVATPKWEPNCWVNIVKPTQEDKEFALETLGVPLAFYEDIEDVDERPRIEIEDGWTFILMRLPCKVEEDETTAPFTTVPLGIMFKGDVFVSVCFYKTDLIPDFINYTKRKGIKRTDNVNFIFRLLLSSSIWFLKYLKQIKSRALLAENQLEQSIRNEDLQTLLKLEKCLVYFTTSLRGNDMLAHRLKNMRTYQDLYDYELVEDVEIESKQALEMTNIYSNIFSGMTETYASVISNNLNIVMKRLTTISIVLMLPTLIASYFGMNLETGTTIFNNLFLIVIVISIVLTGITAYFLLRNGGSKKLS